MHEKSSAYISSLYKVEKSFIGYKLALIHILEGKEKEKIYKMSMRIF